MRGGCGGEPRWKGENGNVERKRKRRKKGNIKHYVQKIREFLRLGESNYSTAARVRMYGTASWGTMIRVRGERHDGVSAGRMHCMYDKVTGDEEMAQGEAKQKAKNKQQKSTIKGNERHTQRPDTRSSSSAGQTVIMRHLRSAATRRRSRTSFAVSSE